LEEKLFPEVKEAFGAGEEEGGEGEGGKHDQEIDEGLAGGHGEEGGDDGDEPILAPNAGGRKIDTGKQLSVVTQTQDGKTTIKVTAVLKDGENSEKKTWEVENVDELPEDIRGDVNLLLGR
jgi:hypothetical protein